MLGLSLAISYDMCPFPICNRGASVMFALADMQADAQRTRGHLNPKFSLGKLYCRIYTVGTLVYCDA